MELIKVDPRALKPNPDKTRRTKAPPQADALLRASIKEVGIVEPPVILPETDGGNGYIIHVGHRRVEQAIEVDLPEIWAFRADPDDKDALRAIVENIAREPLNVVDLWRSIERLAARNWSDEAIAIALALTPRRVKQIRLCASILPAMLDHIAKGDMPNEQQMRTIASASIEEQREVWKKHKPTKADPKAYWPRIAQALTKTRMWAKNASFDEDLAKAYGIVWEDYMFAPENEDPRFTTNVEGFLGAQQEWMTRNLPKRGIVAETNSWGDVKLPPKAHRVHGKPGKTDHVAMYLDRDGTVQSVHYRMPEPPKAKGKGTTANDGASAAPRPRPDVTRKGMDMIGDFRTDALHEALARAPVEDDTLMALLILAFAGKNVTVTSAGESGGFYGFRRFGRHAALLFDQDNKLVLDRETLNQAARKVLIDALSCREDRTNSGIVARVAGDAIGANAFLPNMGTEDFLNCLSRSALEASCNDTPVHPRPRVRETRAELVKHFAETSFVHASAYFAPDQAALTSWLKDHHPVEDEVDEEAEAVDTDEASEAGEHVEDDEAYAVAAE